MIKTEEIRKNSELAISFFVNKLAFTLGPVELHKMTENQPDEIQIIDVRYSDDYFKGHIPDAISIQAKDLESSLDSLSRNKINIVYCYNQQCHLAARAALILAENDFPVMELEGGFENWKFRDFDIVYPG